MPQWTVYIIHNYIIYFPSGLNRLHAVSKYNIYIHVIHSVLYRCTSWNGKSLMVTLHVSLAPSTSPPPPQLQFIRIWNLQVSLKIKDSVWIQPQVGMNIDGQMVCARGCAEFKQYQCYCNADRHKNSGTAAFFFSLFGPMKQSFRTFFFW